MRFDGFCFDLGKVRHNIFKSYINWNELPVKTLVIISSLYLRSLGLGPTEITFHLERLRLRLGSATSSLQNSKRLKKEGSHRSRVTVYDEFSRAGGRDVVVWLWPWKVKCHYFYAKLHSPPFLSQRVWCVNLVLQSSQIITGTLLRMEDYLSPSDLIWHLWYDFALKKPTLKIIKTARGLF